MRRSLSAFLLPTSLFGLGAGTPAIRSQESALRVAYTGRMLGDFRYPDQQPLQGSGFDRCPDASVVLEKQALTLHSQIKKAHHDLLLGMGDNLAPNLDARTFAPAGEPACRKPKDMFAWDPIKHQWAKDVLTSLSSIPVDNVGCFLKLAHYDAVVPGKHDFYYGAERLRQMARFLSSTEKDDRYRPVRMLAANLAVSTTEPGAAPRLASFQKSKRSIWWAAEAGGPNKPIQVAMPEFVTPWLRRIVVRNALDAAQQPRVLKVWLCPVNRPHGVNDPDLIPSPGSEGWAQCQQLTREERAGEGPAGENVAYRLQREFRFTAGPNYGLCLEVRPEELSRFYRDRGIRHTCFPFSVQPPFFTEAGEPFVYHSPAEMARQAEEIERATKPMPPYYIKAIPGPEGSRRYVAVFGVVSRNFRQYIAGLNASWLNADDRYDTSLAVLDPVESLRQALDYCTETEASCRGARKVLLAQMPASEATEISERLAGSFDLVIAQTHPQRGTGSEVVSRTIAQGEYNPTFLVEPKAMPAGATFVRLHLARLEMPRRCMEDRCPGTWKLTHEARTAPVAAAASPGNGPTLEAAVEQLLSKYFACQQDLKQLPAADKATQVALVVMQQKNTKDAALLQRRDIFDPERYLRTIVTRNNLQELLDRLYWKNDYVLPLEVKGATIKAILARSKGFADEDTRSVSVEQGRALATLGIHRDPVTKTLLINGEAVEDDKLYGVNASDHVAHGDTGYPELADSAIQPARRLKDWSRMQSLSGMVCEALKAASSELKDARCNPPLKTEEYLDWIADRPLDTTPGRPPLFQFAEFFGYRHRPLEDVYRGASELERRAQQRPYWAMALEKLEGGFNLYQHDSGSELQLAQRFSGVPVSQVLTPESSSLNAALRFRISHRWRAVDVFGLTDSAYTRNMIRNKDTNAYEPSFLNNRVALEGGLVSRVLPPMRQAQSQGLGLLTSLRLESAVVAPPTIFELAAKEEDKEKQKQKLRVPTRKPLLLTGKIGPRLQKEANWAEFGYQFGSNRSATEGYEFQLTDGSYKACPAPSEAGTGQKSIADCVKDLSASSPGLIAGANSRPIVRPRFQHGFFADFRVSVPLPVRGGWAYVMENHGNYYLTRTGDRSLDTRYFAVWSHSLTIPVVGNFKLVPKLDWYFYENKVRKAAFQAWQTSLNLQYRFDWRQGLPGRALKYPTPAASQ